MYCGEHGLHYNVLSGLIIIIFSRSKGYAYALDRMEICLHGSLELRLVRFVFSKEEEEDEESVKIMFYLYFVTCVIISYNFLHAVTF